MKLSKKQKEVIILSLITIVVICLPISSGITKIILLIAAFVLLLHSLVGLHNTVFKK